MKLVIAEKAELARNIARAVAGAPAGCRLPYEGGGYLVCALAGHVLELDEPGAIDPGRWGDRRDLSVLPILPEPWPKHVKEGKEGLLRAVREGLSRCDSVVHAGDPDDEGQLLVDEVIDYLGCDKPVERVYVNDNLDKSIRRAFSRLRGNDGCRGDGRAAEARSLADFCFGVNESRLIAARGGSGALSVGRVQTPTLGLVVRRDEEILHHRKRKYYVGSATVEIDGRPFAFELKLRKDLLDDEGRPRTSRERVWAALQKCTGTSGTLETTVERKRYPAPLPYNLTDLTADMSKRYKMTAKAVMEATQALREEHRAITYNRSDCNYLPVEARAEAPAVLGAAMANIGARWDLDYSIKGRCFNDAAITAHTGIIPQETQLDAGGLPRDQRRVYEAIVERYAMQFLPEALADVSVSSIAIEEGELRHAAKRAVAAGWKLVRGSGDADDKDLQEGFIEPGPHAYKIGAGKVDERETKPRPPYTEGTLIKDMASIARYVKDPEMRAVLKRKDEGKRGEHGGIGTTATRAATIEALKRKGYLEERAGRLISTELGRAVYHACPEDVRGADLTAKWWLLCEEVRAGRAGVYSVARSVCDEFRKHEDTAYRDIKVSRPGSREVAVCPVCGQPVVDRGDKARTFTCASNRWEKDGDSFKRTAGCGFALWKVVAGKKLTDAQVRDLCAKGRTNLIRGFKSKAGKRFDARLVLEDKAAGKVGFEFEEKKGRPGTANGKGAKGAPKKRKPVRE